MGAHLVRGIRPVEVFSQYLGKRLSSNAGKDSGLHMGDMARGIIGMISVLPDSLPVAVGAALAFKVRAQPNVAMTWFGDGATSTGAFHEAVNCAAVLKVPVVLVCENNQWALSTPNAREFAVPTIAERAAGYGMPGVRVDGNDVEAVFAAAAEAVARARVGDGPTLLECVTMRMRGHSIIDPAEYVPREQLAAWAERDPILRYRTVLELDGLYDPAVEADIAAEVEAAVVEAEAMDDPIAADVYTGVFAAPIQPALPDLAGTGI
jgi:TPP-dependent pyruvate/acetoin dehydrogenase alpha subunit